VSKECHQIAQSSGLSPKASSIHAAETGGPLLLGPRHRYRLGFARFFGMASRNRSVIAAVPPPLVQHPRGLAGRERRRGLGGTSPTPLIGPARPARSHLIRVPGQGDVTRTGAPHGSHLAQAASLVNHYRSGTPAKTAASYKSPDKTPEVGSRWAPIGTPPETKSPSMYQGVEAHPRRGPASVLIHTNRSLLSPSRRDQDDAPASV